MKVYIVSEYHFEYNDSTYDQQEGVQPLVAYKNWVDAEKAMLEARLHWLEEIDNVFDYCDRELWKATSLSDDDFWNELKKLDPSIIPDTSGFSHSHFSRKQLEQFSKLLDELQTHTIIEVELDG